MVNSELLVKRLNEAAKDLDLDFEKTRGSDTFFAQVNIQDSLMFTKAEVAGNKGDLEPLIKARKVALFLRMIDFSEREIKKIGFVVQEPKKTEVKQMNFSEALKLIKMGDKVRRLGWDHNLQVTLFSNCTADIPTGYEDQLVLVDGHAYQHGWVPLIKDIEATDWWVVTE